MTNEKKLQKESLREENSLIFEAAKRHLIDFCIASNEKYDPNWHHEDIATQLERVESGEFVRAGKKILMVFMPPRHGKEISNDVIVPTPGGLKRHGDLHKGDVVYSPDGKEVKVLAEGEEIEDDVRVWFSGGIYVDCHENHEWRVFDRSERRYRILETKRIEKYAYWSVNRSRFQVEAVKRVRRIVKIERRKPKRGKCIQVEGGLYCITKHFIPTHNSELCTIDFPAWYLGRNPDREIITSSYSSDLAVKFGGRTRELIASPVYQLIFPDVSLKHGDKAKGEWMTNKKGVYVSVGVGGAATGRGSNIFLIDDPIKNSEEAESEVYREKIWEWFLTVAWTRLEPAGVMIIILTRWHLDDLAGRILSSDEFRNVCEVVSYPAIAELPEKHRQPGEALWPDRYGIDELEQTKKLLGSKNFSALYQQHPIASENIEFKPQYFKERDETEVIRGVHRRYLTVDTAISKKASADYTGLCDNTVDANNFWNLKAWRMKMSPLELIDLLFTLHNNRRYEKIGIEKTIYLQAIKPFLDEEQRKRNKFLPIVELDHRQVNKEVRIRGLIPRYESGSIYHLKGECRDLEEELVNFPQAINDDVSDATAYQLQIAEKPYESPVRANMTPRKNPAV